MKNKSSLIKKILSSITVFIFIKLAIVLFTYGNQGFDSIDSIFNMAFGVILVLFILFKFFLKLNPNENSPFVKRKNSSSPPSLDNKPLHPK